MKNKKSILRFFLMFPLFLTSCQSDIVFRLFNNTGGDIIVVSYDLQMNGTKYVIQREGSADILRPDSLEIRASGKIWKYDWTVVRFRREFANGRRFGLMDERFQIQGDGSIYVLARATNAIVSKPPPQPEGFPLRPREK